MSGSEFRLLAEDIRTDLGNLSRLKQEIEQILGNLRGVPSKVELRAMASILHDFYCGAERILERVALGMDGGMPGGPEWHTQLLIRMGSEIQGVRPAVLSPRLVSTLKEYLRFRHLFRNIYGFELEWQKIQELVRSLAETHGLFTKDMAAFLDFLKALTRTTST